MLGVTPGGGSHLKAHPHTRLVTDISWQVGLGCQLEHIRAASLCGCLASSQHGGRVPRASVSRELDRNWIPFYGLALEVTQCHFCYSHRPSPVFFFFFFKDFLIYLFIYLFLAVLGLRFVRGLSPVAASGGHSSSQCGDRPSSRCAGLSPSRPLPLRGTGSRRAGSVVVAHGPSRSAACGIFPDQGSNPCPLH